VMEESISIAYTVAKIKLHVIRPATPDRPSFFNLNFIHLHAPEGAISKDGPSAGITLATCLLSLALNQPVLPSIAMTGELTLSGKVLRIGGLKEKTIAAKREGVTNIIFPKANLADWDELPDHIKDGLTPHPVDTYNQVFSICFPAY
jgi:ATP-dependent Lon protease